VQTLLHTFREVWLYDFEFCAPDGERPSPVCLVALELRSGRKLVLWYTDIGSLPPFDLSARTLFVAFFASAELGCHLSLGWSKPACVLDLFTEFRNLTNGLPTIAGNGLLGALAHYGLDAIGAARKDAMHDLVMRGGPWSWEERLAILDYCESDVEALYRLLCAMIPRIDLPRALHRGRYMGAVAEMERVGTPIDMETLHRVQARWDGIQTELITKVDAEYGVYEGTTFKQDKFEDWLVHHDVEWPMLESGQLDLEDETFESMTIIYPQLTKLYELRHTLGQMRLNRLQVGADGYNRCLLSPFRSKSGRNQPSSAKFIFGPAKWVRCLIKPPPGYGVAYIDWVQQEFGIAAALSGDQAMQAAYSTGDSYLAFGKQSGRLPADATKKTHKAEREQFKQCVLGVQYGIWEQALSRRIQQPVIVARHLLKLHHEVFHVFWKWSDNNVDRVALHGSQATVFGWTYHIDPTSAVNVWDPSKRRRKGNWARSHRNFPMQGNGAEMMRLTAIAATEDGIQVCAPVHDAFLIIAPIERLDRDISRMRAIMEKASEVVLGGFKLQTEFTKVVYPNRYEDERGVGFWNTVMSLL
jgi:DNA polymerase-1